MTTDLLWCKKLHVTNTGSQPTSFGAIWASLKQMKCCFCAMVICFCFLFGPSLGLFQLCLLLTNGKPSLLSQCLPHCSHRTQLLALSFLPPLCPFWFWSASARQCLHLLLASRFSERLFKESHHKRLFTKSIPMI